MITEAGTNAVIPAISRFSEEAIARREAPGEQDIAVPAANINSDRTDGEHEAGENIFTSSM